MPSPAWLSKKIDKKGTVKCLACAHYCKIRKGNAGLCMVRKNIAGELQLLVYGKVAAKHIDPIEKKPLFHFMPGASVYSIGTVGCNYRCSFCQNWDISQVAKPPYDNIFGEEITPKEIVDYCVKNNIPCIASTYNEPTIFFEFAYDIYKLAHKKNIKGIFVTNGFFTKEALDKIEPYMDAVNIDLKAFTDKFYMNICGGRLQPVLDSIERVAKTNIWMEITTLLIPGENDSEKEIKQIAKFIAGISKDIPWHISRFFPNYQMMDKEDTPMKTLEAAYEIGKAAGLNYVYIGNISSTKYENTYCPKCKEVVIERQWYETKTHYKKDGGCKKCNTKIPVVLE